MCLLISEISRWSWPRDTREVPFQFFDRIICLSAAKSLALQTKLAYSMHLSRMRVRSSRVDLGRVLTNNGTYVLRWRNAVKMHSARIPENKVTSIRIHFVDLTSSLLEPFYFGLFKPKPVARSPCWSIYGLWMRFEKLGHQLRWPLHDKKSTIFGTIGCKVQDTLHALHSLPQWALVNMRPRLSLGQRLSRGKNKVHAIKWNQKLVCSPEFLKGINDPCLSTKALLEPRAKF